MGWSKDNSKQAELAAEKSESERLLTKEERQATEKVRIETLAVKEANKTKWLPAVATVALRNSTYPNPKNGDTVKVTGESRVYRYDSVNGWVVTDEYNATAIDNVTAQLADTVMKNEFKQLLPKYSLKLRYLNSNSFTKDAIGTAYTLSPLEHRKNSGFASNNYMTDEFYSIANGNFIFKTTNGIDFSLVADITALHGGSNWVTRQLTDDRGRHIIFNNGTIASASGNIELYSPDYKTKYQSQPFTLTPYAIQGIEQSPYTKTIMYAEYGGDTNNTMSVWRSTMSGANIINFTKVLEVATGSVLTREMRHFHVCAHDPFKSGRWYVSSGDNPDESRMWVSDDDGLTWTKINTDGRVKSVHYFIDNTHLYWTADSPNGGFYRMNKTTFAIETLIPEGVLSGLGYSVISSPYGWVCFYEKSPVGLDTENSYIYLIDKDFKHHVLTKTKDDLTAFKSRHIAPMSGNIYSQVTPKDDPFNLKVNSRILILNIEQNIYA